MYWAPKPWGGWDKQEREVSEDGTYESWDRWAKGVLDYANDWRNEVPLLTHREVVANARRFIPTGVCGVYMCMLERCVVNVGQGIDIATRIDSHIKSIPMDSFCFVTCRREQLNALEKRYILEFWPEHNTRQKPKGHVKHSWVHVTCDACGVKLLGPSRTKVPCTLCEEHTVFAEEAQAHSIVRNPHRPKGGSPLLYQWIFSRDPHTLTETDLRALSYVAFGSTREAAFQFNITERQVSACYKDKEPMHPRQFAFLWRRARLHATYRWPDTTFAPVPEEFIATERERT